MFDIAEKSMSEISRAAALHTKYLEAALAGIGPSEMYEFKRDVALLEAKGSWSARIIEVMKRGRLIADADAMMARMEAA